MAKLPFSRGVPRVAQRSAAQQVARIAALAPVEAAAAWFLAHEEQLLERQMEVTRIAAPPFGEAARAEWLAARFRELGLERRPH